MNLCAMTFEAFVNAVLSNHLGEGALTSSEHSVLYNDIHWADFQIFDALFLILFRFGI